MKMQYLRERIIVERKVTRQSDSGALHTEWEMVCKPYAWKRRRGASGITEIAHEERNEQVALLTIWRNDNITYDCRIRWSTFLWEISMIEKEGREMTLTLKKIDD